MKNQKIINLFEQIEIKSRTPETIKDKYWQAVHYFLQTFFHSLYFSICFSLTVANFIKTSCFFLLFVTTYNSENQVAFLHKKFFISSNLYQHFHQLNNSLLRLIASHKPPNKILTPFTVCQLLNISNTDTCLRNRGSDCSINYRNRKKN